MPIINIYSIKISLARILAGMLSETGHSTGSIRIPSKMLQRLKNYRRSFSASDLQTAQADFAYFSVLSVLHGEAHNGWKRFGKISQGQFWFLVLSSCFQKNKLKITIIKNTNSLHPKVTLHCKHTFTSRISPSCTYKLKSN